MPNGTGASNAIVPLCPVVMVPRAAEMCAYDALPPAVRRALAAAKFNLHAILMGPIIAQHGERAALGVIATAQRIIATEN